MTEPTCLEISFWDEEEREASLKNFLGYIPNDKKYEEVMFFYFEITTMEDKRGKFGAIHFLNFDGKRIAKYRIKTIPYEEILPYVGVRVNLKNDMYGWNDCSMSEWSKLDEIISKREENPPLPPNINKRTPL